MKIFTGHLTADGHSIPDEEILLYILGGLGHEYDALATSLTTRTELIDLDELHGYLFSHELRIENNCPPTSCECCPTR